MRSFHDESGRQWNIDIDDAAIARVATIGVDLTRPRRGDVDLLSELGRDTALMCAVLNLVLQPQAESRGIKPEDFNRELGDCAAAVGAAFTGAIIDTLTPEHRKLARQFRRSL